MFAVQHPFMRPTKNLGAFAPSIDQVDATGNAAHRVPFAIAALSTSQASNACSEHRISSPILLHRSGSPAGPFSRMIKSLFDRAAALVLLLLLAPVMLAIAVVVRADKGSALYGHRRVGENGRHFYCLKFRSMVTEGDQVLQQLLARDTAALQEWQATQKLRDDPRVTHIGRVLRKTSLDELPQLLNVLRGEMSLVGPRPIVDAEIDRYGQDISFYYDTRPGITGLWQVSGRSNMSYEGRVRLDVWYARNWSLWRDFWILLRTIPAVLARNGAV